MKDLKKLFGGLSKNVWYGVEEDRNLVASNLGSAVVTVKKFCRCGRRAMDLFTYLASVGTLSLARPSCDGRRGVVGLEVRISIDSDLGGWITFPLK